jgi:hypothetical protein
MPQNLDPEAPYGRGKDGTPNKKPGPPKGVRLGGRQKGARNKAIIEREERERLIRTAAAAATLTQQVTDEVALRKGTPDSKRAKLVLENFMELFAQMAARAQPLPEGMAVPQGRMPDPVAFDKYSKLAVDTAGVLAPFQDPRYSAVMVGQTQVTKVTVSGGMPDEFSGPGSEYIELKATEVVSAEDPVPLPVSTPKAVNE